MLTGYENAFPNSSVILFMFSLELHNYTFYDSFITYYFIYKDLS
jgi:hypothetical protein